MPSSSITLASSSSLEADPPIALRACNVGNMSASKVGTWGRVEFMSSKFPDFGEAWTDRARSESGCRQKPVMTAAGLLAYALAAIFKPFLGPLSQPSQADRARACPIKGNISRSGSRIYHLPWQASYARTKIDERAGERWFCDQGEAERAGWRRAR